jgi:hypothetical protein
MTTTPQTPTGKARIRYTTDSKGKPVKITENMPLPDPCEERIAEATAAASAQIAELRDELLSASGDAHAFHDLFESERGRVSGHAREFTDCSLAICVKRRLLAAPPTEPVE